MSVDKIDLNPALNVKNYDEEGVSRNRPKANLWCKHHRSTTHNTADYHDPPRDDEANQDQSGTSAEEAKAANQKNQKCAYCERRGHAAEKCWLKEKHERARVDANMADLQKKQRAYFAGVALSNQKMTPDQLSNLFKGMVAQGRK